MCVREREHSWILIHHHIVFFVNYVCCAFHVACGIFVRLQSKFIGSFLIFLHCIAIFCYPISMFETKNKLRLNSWPIDSVSIWIIIIIFITFHWIISLELIKSVRFAIFLPTQFSFFFFTSNGFQLWLLMTASADIAQ